MNLIEPWTALHIENKLDAGEELNSDELDDAIEFWSYINKVAEQFEYNLLFSETNKKIQKYSRIKAGRINE